MRINEVPYNASIESGENSLVLILNSNQEIMGSVEVVARDISRCLAFEDNDDSCRDMDLDDFKKYESEKSFDYEIKIDASTKAANEAKKLAEEQKAAKCKAGLIQAGLGVVVGAIGNTTTTTNKGSDGKTSTSTSQTTNSGQIVNSVTGGE